MPQIFIGFRFFCFLKKIYGESGAKFGVLLRALIFFPKVMEI